MKKILLTVALLSFSLAATWAQTYMTRTGKVYFNATTKNSPETIEAKNNEGACRVDSKTGDVRFQVLIKSFKFERSAMQEHFNENYMESEKYPKASFKGRISDPKAVDFKKNGTYDVVVEGDLTIRDVTKKISVKGTVEVITGGVNANAKFIIAPEDFNIKIPSVVREKIAKNLEVTVAMKYAPI